jgi:hypothetical protein
MNNRKGVSEMPIEKVENEMYRKYDGMVGKTLWNIFVLSRGVQRIRLLKFDRKNQEHLFVLRIALFARDVYGFDIEVESSWWDVFCLNWKLHKSFDKIVRAKTSYTGIGTDELLDFMRPELENELGAGAKFDQIYNTYYEGSLN